MVSSSLGYGTSAPCVMLVGRAANAIAKGEAVQFHATAASRIAAVPDTTDTNSMLLVFQKYDNATTQLMAGVAMNTAATDEWIEVAVYGPVLALCNGTTDINAGDTVAADAGAAGSVAHFESMAEASITAHSHGHALEDYTDATDALKWIFVDVIAKGVNDAGTTTLFMGGRIIGV